MVRHALTATFIYMWCGGAWVAPAPVHQDAAARPSRIVSLIPAVTETLFAIGAGPQVIAVSSFDRYPPEVEKLQRVGALFDPDLERILSLRPDFVVLYASQTDLEQQLQRAGVATFHYRHGGLADITATMRELGQKVGRRSEADRVASEVEAHLDRVRMRVASSPRVKAMIVFGREERALRGIYASGGVGFLHAMLEAAGGANVFADVKRESVQASAELIIARRPEAILELRITPLDAAAVRGETAVWKALASVPAVRNGRVHIFTEDKMVVPGPRVGEATELLSRALHPRAWK